MFSRTPCYNCIRGYEILNRIISTTHCQIRVAVSHLACCLKTEIANSMIKYSSVKPPTVELKRLRTITLISESAFGFLLGVESFIGYSSNIFRWHSCIFQTPLIYSIIFGKFSITRIGQINSFNIDRYTNWYVICSIGVVNASTSNTLSLIHPIT